MPRSSKHFSVYWLWGLVLLLTAANVIGWFAQRESVYEAELASAMRGAEIATDAFAEETEQMFRQIDLVLRGIRAYHLRSGSIADTERYIDELRLDGSRIENGYLVDAQGRLVITHNPATVGRSVADRDYFSFHQATPQDQPFVSAVELGRATGKYLFRVTRRIDDAQGRFAGVALVTVKPAAIAEFYARLTKKDGSTAALISTRDRRVRARVPEPAPEAWARVLETPLWDKLRQSPSGRYSAKAAIDGVPRHFVYRAIPEWDMVVITGIPQALVQARARQQLDQYAVAMAGFNLVLVGLALVLTYIDRQRRHVKALNRQQEAMLDNDLIGITKLKDRHALWVNRALERMFGYEPGELESHPARLLYPDDASYEALGAAAYPVLAAGGSYRTQQRLVRKDGTPIWVDMSGALVSPESNESLWMMLDITAMKEQHAEVEQIAFHDLLTGLPNRVLLADRLRQAIPLTQRMDRLLAVCFIDLDGFKAVNDRLGHAAGDRLLQVIAQRLRDCMRSNDTVARLGGDEFILLLTQLHTRAECSQVLARVVKAIGEPVDLGQGETGRVSASIGVAFCPDDGEDADQLLKLADGAMYAAKKAGRNKVITT